MDNKKVNKLAKPLREKDSEALKKELADTQKQVYALRSQSVTQKIENPHQATTTRRQIARIKTILRQRQIEKRAAKQTETAKV